jgi:thioredoxin-related protein
LNAPLLLLLLTAATCFAGDVKWRSFDAGLAEAKKTHKKILLDVYTDWCKWCTKLDKEVYTNDKVSKYLTKAYIPVKLNGEGTGKVSYKSQTTTEMGLAQSFGIRSYPTIIFLDSGGEPINSLGGFVDAERFLPIITYIGDDHYKSISWEEYKTKNGIDMK